MLARYLSVLTSENFISFNLSSRLGRSLYTRILRTAGVIFSTQSLAIIIKYDVEPYGLAERGMWTGRVWKGEVRGPFHVYDDTCPATSWIYHSRSTTRKALLYFYETIRFRVRGRGRRGLSDRRKYRPRRSVRSVGRSVGV